MIHSSQSLIEVIMSILDYDDSILYRPNLLKGLLLDYYKGPDDILKDFFSILDRHCDEIADDLAGNLHTISSAGIEDKRRDKIQEDIFRTVYIDRDLDSLSRLGAYIVEIYKEEANYWDDDVRNPSNSSTIKFEASRYSSLIYGDIITLSWTCPNSYKVVLSNGRDKMNVTNLNSIEMSAMFDKYFLILYDAEYKESDRLVVNMDYREHAFCINCGERKYRDDDEFCYSCGIRFK